MTHRTKENGNEPCPSVGDLSGPFLVAILAGDESDAERLFATARQRGASLAQLVRDLVVPSLAEVGRMWSVGAASIAEEHLATVLVSRLVSRAGAQVSCPRTGARRVLFSCVAGEFHDLGIRLSCEIAREVGWEAECLGANVPREELVAFVRQRRPDAVALSVALAGHLPECARTIEEIRRAVPDVAIVVGGQAFQPDAALARVCGADACIADSVGLQAWLQAFAPPGPAAPPVTTELPPRMPEILRLRLESPLVAR